MVKVAVDKAEEQAHYKLVSLLPPTPLRPELKPRNSQTESRFSEAKFSIVTNLPRFPLSRATVGGGFRTGLVGLSSALVLSVAAQRSGNLAYRSLTLPLKAFAVTSITTASFIIGADAASRKYELAKYAVGSGTSQEIEFRRSQELEKEAGIFKADPKKSGRELSTQDALVEWAKDHRYSGVFGAWAASMVGSWAYISMTPLSFAQKLVQARMVAQGLTVVVLIASAGLSSIPTQAGGQNEEEIKREHREDGMFKWKKGSPHDLAEHHLSDHKASAVVNAVDSSAAVAKSA